MKTECAWNGYMYVYMYVYQEYVYFMRTGTSLFPLTNPIYPWTLSNNGYKKKHNSVTDFRFKTQNQNQIVCKLCTYAYSHIHETYIPYIPLKIRRRRRRRRIGNWGSSALGLCFGARCRAVMENICTIWTLLYFMLCVFLILRF